MDEDDRLLEKLLEYLRQVRGFDFTLHAINRRGQTIKCSIICTPLIDSNQERQGIILLMEETPTS